MTFPVLALFTRALREDSRAKLPPILRAVALGFVLLLIWANESDFTRSSAPGLGLLGMITAINFVGLTLIALGTFPSAITEEKEDDTLPLMRMTRLGPLSILLGKSTARLVSALLFLSVQFPFTLLCVALGGTSTAQIARIYAILAVYIFFLCNLGLLMSVLARRTRQATSYVFGLAMLLYVGAPILYYTTFARVIANGGGGWWEYTIKYLSNANPVYQLFQTFASSWFGASVNTDVFIFHIVAGVVCFAAAWMLFERFCGPTGEAVRVGKKARGGRRYSRPWKAAVAWKDFCFLTGGTRGWLIRSVLYALLIGVFVAMAVYFERARNPTLTLAQAIRDALDQRTLGRIIVTTAWTIFTLELALVAARIFGAERKQHTLGTLFIIPMPTWRLVWQKARGCALGFLPSLALWAIGMVLLYRAPVVEMNAYNLRYQYGYIVATYAFTAAAYVCFAVFIAYLSLRMRRGALLTGLLAAFGWYIVVNVIAMRMMMRRVRNWSGSGGGFDDYFDWMTNAYILQAIALAIIAFFLAMNIPGRLARTAAEE